MCPPRELPARLKHFIVEHIDSVELVRVLFLLHDAPDAEWTIDSINREIRSCPESIENRLQHLYDQKILKKSEGAAHTHKYEPYSDDMKAIIDELSEFNQTFSTRIIEQIYARPDEALKAFVSAFKVKKDR